MRSPQLLLLLRLSLPLELLATLLLLWALLLGHLLWRSLLDLLLRAPLLGHRLLALAPA